MDIQDKLSFSGQLSNHKQSEIIDLNNIPDNNILMSFSENSNITVKLESNRFDVFIECLSEHCNCEFKFMNKLTNGIMFKMNDMDTNLYPSIYTILIVNKANKETTCKYYKVLPLIAIEESDSFEALRTVISSYSNQLLYDFNRKKSLIIIEREMGKDAIPLSCEKILENGLIVEKALVNCANNLIVNLEKRITDNRHSGKQNEKTIIKNIIGLEEKYSLRSTESYDCVENSSLLFYLHESARALVELDCKLQLFVQSYQKSITTRQTMIKSSNQTHFINRIQMEIDDYTEKYKLFRDTSLLITSLLVKINLLEYNSLLTNVKTRSIQLTPKFLSNKFYRIIYRSLYKVVCNKDSIGSKYSSQGQLFGYSYRSTASLYEFYCYICIITALENNGFVIDPLYESSCFDDLYLINSETSVTYTNGKVICRLLFDKKVEKISNRQELELVNINSFKDRPDFQLLFFDEDKNLLNSTIMDAKCRKLRSIKLINDEGYENENMVKMVSDYMQFKYIKEGEPLLQSTKGVSDLFILCPDMDLSEAYADSIYGVRYIPMKPVMDICSDYGVGCLSEHIKNIIDINNEAVSVIN